MKISKLVQTAHENAVAHGWWAEGERNFAELLCLIHSEVSEALEDYRAHKGIAEIYYEDNKPCGIPIELADIVIRVADLCGQYGIDLDQAISRKHIYNMSRPYRHGKKI